MENGVVPKRSDAFPAGLRVLVVDDDPTWLKILEKMLRKCSYEVTKCSLASDALDMLRKRKDGFDIVISDVNMPDMDGFKLLEHVGFEMNLPVIMMSVDGEISRVMKGVLHGACDYLLKPIRMKELQNIWQHVLRKKIHEVKEFEIHESGEGIQKIRNNLDAFDDSHLLAGGDVASARKRKYLENHELDDQDFSDASVGKKGRVVWSVDLHQKFVSAVDQIGLDKVGPKKILDLMNIPWLTRENVASHLQKYRLYLSRLEKQNQPSSMDPSSFSHQDNASSYSFGYSGNKPRVNPDIQEVNSNHPKAGIRKLDCGSRTGFANSFGFNEMGPSGIFGSIISPTAQGMYLLEDGYIEFNNLEFPDYFDPGFIADPPTPLHDGLRFNSDFLLDSIDYPTMNQGLFIA